jgi:PAT family beta-lactamase induction signal transducer AmpG
VQGNGRNYKFFLLGSLYFTQMLPMAFFFSGLPVIMRKGGYSLEHIAYLGLMGIPYSLKFLWAPYIDRGAGNANHYKKIVLVMTVCYAIVSAIASQINPQDNLIQLTIILSVALTFLATQDIAVDAIATRILTPAERGFGNGLQAAGAFSGYFFGGGVMLIIFDSVGGWANSVLILSAILVVALIPLFFFHEPAGPVKSRANIKDIFTFFKRKEIIPSLLVAVFSGIFLEVSYRKMRPLMVDAGFETEQIGLYISIIGMASGIISSLLFGYMMKWFGLRKGFIYSLAFGLLAFPALMLPAMGYVTSPFILGAVLLGGACSGAMHATVYALYMNNGREGKEGSDFTVQNALAFLLTYPLGILFGKLADKQGYLNLFIVAAILHVFIVILAVFIVRNKKSDKKVLDNVKAEVGELAESGGTSL